MEAAVATARNTVNDHPRALDVKDIRRLMERGAAAGTAWAEQQGDWRTNTQPNSRPPSTICQSALSVPFT